MTGLSSEELDILRARLDAREAELGAQVRGMNEEAEEAPSRAAPHNVGDLGEQGEELIRGAVRHAEKERDQMELRQIADARERMDLGTYGSCVDCGADIPVERLEVLPFSDRCVSCQEAYEAANPIGVRIPPAL
ncbi:DksA-like zinc finger domain containing protein [Variovorax sp. PBL-H6]|uniref:TraR/DksA family transcriptional regulator n=1 Tax=Variovorax sp. PBL-H6 TaxID=434009 RepID=UPI001316A011|nr:TraR/DksA C4-type zinc finger protein [Variovorax sp. PBL-H6]VTU22353.1 DksA-like zinc finger domain containing protein [Variovorax sp. PBL-H6]